MNEPDIATIQTLRSDLALQIARFVGHRGRSQVETARILDIPQPTLSKIMNAQVAELSLELLIRIAVRAHLPVILQTGNEPAEAGVFVSGAELTDRVTKSRLSDQARAAQGASAQRLTPEQRLDAHLKHCELLAALRQAAQTQGAGKSAGPRSRTR
jgi:predicted XRE-type DNA-binding protein